MCQSPTPQVSLPVRIQVPCQAGLEQPLLFWTRSSAKCVPGRLSSESILHDRCDLCGTTTTDTTLGLFLVSSLLVWVSKRVRKSIYNSWVPRDLSSTHCSDLLRFWVTTGSSLHFRLCFSVWFVNFSETCLIDKFWFSRGSLSLCKKLRRALALCIQSLHNPSSSKDFKSFRLIKLFYQVVGLSLFMQKSPNIIQTPSYLAPFQLINLTLKEVLKKKPSNFQPSQFLTKSNGITSVFTQNMKATFV